MMTQGDVALVTGAGRGIGRAVALALGEAGARVALLSRTASDVESAAALPQTREIERALAPREIGAEREKTVEQVVPRGDAVEHRRDPPVVLV